MDELPLPKPGATKAVTIVAGPESFAPVLPPNQLDDEENKGKVAPRSPKQHRASVARRPSGRPLVNASTSSFHSITSQSSFASSFRLDSNTSRMDSPKVDGITSQSHRHRHSSKHLVSQIAAWLHEEKAKRTARKTRAQGHLNPKSGVPSSTPSSQNDDSLYPGARRPRGYSDASDEGISLEKLEQILAEHSLADPDDNHPRSNRERREPNLSRRASSIRKLRKGSTAAGSSDTEYHEGDALVPTAEVFLDNSKTLSYFGGTAESEPDLSNSSKRAAKEGWLIFKNEILRLTHTLRLKGWRMLPLERGGDIDVERLSGALTNAVYVVSPPKDLEQTPSDKDGGTAPLAPKKPPPKLLLRIYGPQVEHLIDRENELQILRRLARKKIGPRLLGTFVNGRFEEFFHARTLTAHDLRVPATSKQIAKRMRELHEGIELLEEERAAGPFVWRNWDKWVDRCEEVISWLDNQILSGNQSSARTPTEMWKQRGLICGVEWSVFRETVNRYRAWLDKQYGGTEALRQQLVFAHNDTQYGNLLRLEPSGESPLLLPVNEHKQLIVIDFEYASANLPGLEFANHFTEWCYNYHDAEKPYSLTEANYPTKDEQRTFLKAYVQHRPQFHARASATSATAPGPGPSSSISSFMLDSRAPPAQLVEEEKERDEATEREVKRLMREAHLWRVANTAQWVAWGIVQAKVPGMDEALEDQKNPSPESERTARRGSSTSVTLFGSDPLDPDIAEDIHNRRPERLDADAMGGATEVPTKEEDTDEFDYLGYAHERAMFFWGDALSLGIVRKEDLPVDVLRKVKMVEY